MNAEDTWGGVGKAGEKRAPETHVGPWFLTPGPFSGQMAPFANTPLFSGDVTKG